MEIKIENANLLFLKKWTSKILEEILSNAMKISKVKTKNYKWIYKGEHYYITIQDFGKGMTQEEIHKVESFIQFDRQVSEQSGLGLGLALVKKIIDIDQGEFWLESEKRKAL